MFEINVKKIDETKKTNCGSFSHMGLDVSAPNGTPIWAVAGGDIVYSKNNSWGNMVKITTKHKGATWTHLYAHMNEKDWNKYKEYHSKKGNKVARGELIGGVGNTGQSGGNHLHIEVMLSGTVGGKQYSNVVVEPISLAEGKIVERGVHSELLNNKKNYYEFYKNKYCSNIIGNDELRDRLIEFRKQRSNEMGVPAYYVFTNDELDKLIEVFPDYEDAHEMIRKLS